MDKVKMENGKILPLLVELSIPAMIGMFVNAVYNIVDRMFIGNTPGLGSLGLAGITISFPVTFNFNGFKFDGWSRWSDTFYYCIRCKGRREG